MVRTEDGHRKEGKHKRKMYNIKTGRKKEREKEKKDRANK